MNGLTDGQPLIEMRNCIGKNLEDEYGADEFEGGFVPKAFSRIGKGQVDLLVERIRIQRLECSWRRHGGGGGGGGRGGRGGGGRGGAVVVVGRAASPSCLHFLTVSGGGFVASGGERRWRGGGRGS